MENNYQVKLTPLAHYDLIQILDYINNNCNNPSAAKKQKNDFLNAFDNLRSFPASAPIYHNPYFQSNSVRKLVVNNYIAFYHIVEREVQILRIVHNLQNYKDLLTQTAFTLATQEFNPSTFFSLDEKDEEQER